MTFLHKLIITNKHLRYTPFWWWFRLMSHSGFRFDDYHLWAEFWYSINKGYVDTEYKWEFEKFWGKNAKVETIILPQRNFDALIERLNQPPDPKVVERLTEILRKPSPWDT